jgi:hypothetical protein
MVSESQPDLNKSVPLSQGLAKRRVNQPDRQPIINVGEDRLREILGEVIDQQVSDKIRRLETSINRMVDHFEAVRCGEAEDSSLRVTTDMSAADLAIAAISLPSEDFYIYTTEMLADQLVIKPYIVQKLIKQLDLKGKSEYHRIIKTGKSEKSRVHKYSDAALQRLKDAMKTTG